MLARPPNAAEDMISLLPFHSRSIGEGAASQEAFAHKPARRQIAYPQVAR